MLPLVLPGHRLRLLLAVASLVGCTLLNPNRQLITRDRATMFLVQDNAEVERMLSLQRIQDAETEQFWRAKHSKEEGIQRVVDMQENPTRHSSAVNWRDPNPAGRH